MSTEFTKVRAILDTARWAPSGDNEQPWKFKLKSETSFDILIESSNRDLYSTNAWPTYLAVGCLLESIALASATQGMEARFDPDYSRAPELTSIQVTLIPSAAPVDPLTDFIKGRSVHRRVLSPRKLSQEHKNRLQAAVGDSTEIVWIESWHARMNMLKATLLSSFIRTTIPETFEIHNKAIHWNARFSETGMPDQAIGASKISLIMGKWVLKNQKRMLFLNRYLGGTVIPHIEMDLMPGIFCGAHFFLKSRTELKSVADFVEYGRKVQRLWLAATSLGIQQQPNIATLAFSEFGRTDVPFTKYAPALRQAKKLSSLIDRKVLENTPPTHVAWAGRLGYGAAAKSRSLRLPLDQLIVES